MRHFIIMLASLAGMTFAAHVAAQDKNFIIQIPVDVNVASEQTLVRVMDGVGPRKAHAIVLYRQSHGPFHSVKELTNVKGIGAGTLKRNAGRISVNKGARSG